MIKTQLLVRRKPGMSLDEFGECWLRIHASPAARIAGIARQTVSIVRNERARADAEWDGLANTWWDSREALAAARQSGSFGAMREDEAALVDGDIRKPLVVVEVNPLAPSLPPEPDPDLIKIVNPLHKLAALGYDAFSAYWRGPHATLNAALPHMNAYIQNHIHPDFRDEDRACDGIAESWFRDWDEIRALLASEANARLREDEANLIVPGSLHPMVCREYRTV